MIRHGEHPFLECSSDGDRRFSAFFARIEGRGNRTIEEIYQAAKVFRNGDTGLTIKEAKGFRPTNAKHCAELYAKLWDEYIDENPHLLEPLLNASGVSDRFGRRGGVCQATELWRIRGSKQRLVTISIGIGRDGSIYEDTQCHGNPWGEVYRGLVAVRARLDELIGERRECPFNPKNQRA